MKSIDYLNNLPPRSSHLVQAGISFRQDLARTEYLSNADDRLQWQANSLPADDLCTENAIMLQRFNRYPLVIDPSGQATEFILNEYRLVILFGVLGNSCDGAIIYVIDVTW